MGNEHKPLITVVTVCYNAVNELEKTMLSVLNQTYDNIEYIVIDGGSKDGTVDIIKKYADRLAYWVSEPDKGIYDAMNKGIKAATGEWINFMNAGDLFVDNNIISKLLNATSDSGDIRIIRGNIFRIYPKFKVKSVGVTQQIPSLIDMFDNTFHHQACLIQTSLFKDYGLYSLDYKLISDWKFFFDCTVLHHVKSTYVDITVAEFQMNGASTNHSYLYRDERRNYLKSLYGEDLFSLLSELSVYRKSRIIRTFYKLRTRFISQLSQKNFSRIMKMKRFFIQILGKSTK